MIEELKLELCPTPLVGIDEVGRGCLAGPVVAAAVIFKTNIDIHLYNDSKKFTEKQREALAESIHLNHIVGIGWASVEEIDEINILQATFVAMKRALEKIQINQYPSPTLLIDGRDKIPNLGSLKQIPIIKGDQKVRQISAASLVAKVARDQFMINLGGIEDRYGFAKHKGYGTLFHRNQIKKHGPNEWHRKKFGGVKEHLI